MSRNKPILFLLMLALLLPITAQASVSPNLIDAQSVAPETANYNLHAVELGTYERGYSSSCREYYPYTYSLRFDTPNAKFKEYTVKRNQQVKKGDVLAVFTLAGDEVALSTQRLSLQRAQEDLKTQTEAYQERLDEMYMTLTMTAERFEREMLALKIAYEEVSMEKYIYQQNVKIADIQKKIEELEEASEDNVLVAPADGVVTKLNYVREGDRVSTSEVLITLYREEGLLYRVDNSSDYFRYGMKVNVEVGPGKNRTILTGTVVAADTLIPASRRTKHAFIRLDPYDESLRMNNPTAKAPTEQLSNIIVVPRQAVELEAGKYYVTKYVNGTLQKRYVQFIKNNTTSAWLMQGIEPGETIIIE